MEFLVEFDLKVPDGTPESEVEERVNAEAAASAALAVRDTSHGSGGRPSRRVRGGRLASTARKARLSSTDCWARCR